MTPIPACPRCGAPLAEHDRFCSRCGAALPDTPTAAREASPTESSAAEVERRLRAACGPEYQIIRELGTGGMGSVFLAREPALKRDVAVKVLAPDLAGDATARARFQREAQACASLAHPNIVAVHRVGEFGDGTPYFIMQHVAGESLAARIAREGPADLNEARRMLGQVALALAAAHAKGIIHRDIKPANVLYDAESGRVLVSDFGIAAVRRAGEVDAQAHLTGTGMAIGTPQYMSPEQLLAEAVTEKADVYSLGLLGYELIAGRGPFDITSPLEILAAVLRDTPRRLSELRPEADTELEILLAACLDRDPKARPTASEVAKRLGVDTTPLLEWPPPGLESLLGGARELRNRTVLGTVPLAAAVLVMLLGADAVAGVAAAGTALASVVVIGVLLALRAIPVLWRLGLTGSAARRRGYEWNLVDEVLADSRGDTGALITGTREYAGLAPATRGQLRRWRVTRAASGVLAAVFPVVWAPFVFAAGSRGWIGSSQAFLLVLVPSTAFSAIPLSLWFREDRLLCAARARRRVGGRADAGPDRRVSWLSGFGSASRAQGPWPQRTERAALG
ncbi:MAG: protein kinase, partial [Gemmatimonadetes bacterium]|nr:protein kinase [Gemmatimonadota bacterium]